MPDAPAEPDVLPLLPKGTPIFAALPAAAVVLDALPPAVGDGIVVARRGLSAGVVVVRDGALEKVYCFDGDRPSDGQAALSRIASWDDATMSATRLTHAEVDLLDQLLAGESCYEDLRIEWTDWAGFLRDLRARPGSFVIELRTPGGRGITCVRNGEHTATYTEAHPETGDISLLDALAAQGTGSIRVLTRAPEPRHARASDSVNGDRDVTALLLDLKLLARARLQLSARTVELLLDEAAASQSSLDDVAGDVRTMSIRGVMQSTLDQLADDMLRLAPHRDG